MKKLLLTVLTLAAVSVTNAQNCSDLFFSEYVEGSGNNKALEIYNPTANPITINNDYRIVRYNNGMSAATAHASAQTYVILGHHVIQPYDVWVITVDKRDAGAPCPGNECAVDAALQAVSDTFVTPDYNICWALYHNGNDAISLQKFVGGNWTYVDIFGEIGVDPAPSWSDMPPLYDGSAGAYYTLDQTLIRKSSVQKGVTVNPSPFIAPAEWDSLPRNTYTQLGFHNCNCQSIGLAENTQTSQVKVFPNPAVSGSALTIYAAGKNIASVNFYNALGQLVKTVAIENPAVKVSVDAGLSKGIYLSEIVFEDKSTTAERLIIE
ncbi:MAG: hypothetical protein K0S33_294 [Bacteroidetes bacterium]|jgi:hypothetical protein|nr:hypothetical protein [Bacteroidota bacterium]